MDRASALDRLEDPDSDVRLRAARALARSALPPDEAAIRRRRRVESVPWIRAALENAFARLTENPTGPPPSASSSEDAPDREDIASSYLGALQFATERVVHELRSVVGTLRYWAEKEYSGYSGSQTERQVDRLRRCLEAIDLLGKVSRSPAIDEFDLAQLIDDEAVAVTQIGARVTRVGTRPALVRGDSGVLALVLRNAMQNAAEAAGDSPGEIHVNWGETRTEYWVAVFDRGPGLPREAEALFDFGSSTKRHHVGAGLAIVAQAAIAVGGNVSLSEEADSTTKFEFRWPRIVEQAGANPAG